jgi:hypothetical protein
MQRVLGCTALWLVVSTTVRADAPLAERYLEFRDGSLLRLPVLDATWKVTVVRPDGRIEMAPLRLSSLQSLTLTPEDEFSHKRLLLSAVRQLSSSTFEDRESAQSRLLKMGAAVRQDLQTCLHLCSDPEARARLRAILAQMPMDPNVPARTNLSFDLFQIKDQPLWGDVGGDGITILLDGVKHRLTRKDVAAMTEANPVQNGNQTPVALAGFQRIGPNDFPRGCVEEPFERTPDGRPLRIGENIERLFLGKGFLLSTSIKTSFVSVNSFVVEGKSRGLSAANHQPLWEGEITVKFVRPGHENVPAVVTHFGCYIAAVVPQGTALCAYDLQGRELGKIHTERNGVDFLGVRSAVPMHKIKFVPNLSLDRDYTLDDFIFTPPLTRESLHPDRFTVYLTSGDRVVCGDVVFGKDGAQLQGLPAGLPDRTYALGQILRVVAPTKGRPETPPPAGVFAELRDGSVILGTLPANKTAAPVFARRPQALEEQANLAGLWGSDFPRLIPKAMNGKAALWDADRKRWQDLSYVRLLEEVALWKGTDGAQGALPYRKLSPLWLASPGETPSGRWHVRTVQGEELVLSATGQMSGRLSQGLSALWQGQPLRIPAAEVGAIFQVPGH